MCQYYFSHDITARKDLKLQKLQVKVGREGKSVFWDLLELLAETSVEEGGEPRLPLDTKLLAALLGDCSPRLVGQVIRDFGLFVIDKDAETGKVTFYNQRLMERFYQDVLKRPETLAQAPEVTTDKRGRRLSSEARARMAHGGRRYRPTDQGTSKVDTKVDQGSDQGTSKVDTKVDQGSDQGTSKVDTKVDQGSDKGTSKVDTKVDQGTSKVDTKVDQGSNQGTSKVDQGNGGNIGGLKAQKEKAKRGKGELAPVAPEHNELIERYREIEGDSPMPRPNGVLTPVIAVYNEVRRDFPDLPPAPDYDTHMFWQAKELTDAWGGENFRERLGQALRRAAASSFLRSKPKNLYNYIWLTKLSNLEKIETGKYDNDEPKASTSRTSYSNAAQHPERAAPTPTSSAPPITETQEERDRRQWPTLDAGSRAALKRNFPDRYASFPD